MPGARVMYDKAIAALRAQQERENPRPLTLDELREMVKKPIWIEFIHKSESSQYRIVRGFSGNDILFEEYDKEFGPYKSAYLGHYGNVWRAYRHKPKGG